MSYNLSVVNVISDQYKNDVNQIAELYGCGPNNISVQLQDVNGAVFWGCHAFWTPEDYAAFSDPTLREQVIPSNLLTSLEFLYERLVLEGNAQDNWKAALIELGLTEVIYE